MATPPLVRAISQFDGGPKQALNCMSTSFARLLLYARGILTTGTKVRSLQSDQVGGSSIPDNARATHTGWSFEPEWAAPNDTNAGRDPIPVNKRGDYISATKLWDLLKAGYMCVVAGDYGNLPVQYREQESFTDDHAFTVDMVRDTPTRGREAYIVDTIPRYSEGYDGRWIPWSALLSYAYGLAGTGRVYAAWAKPKAATPTPEEDTVHSMPEANGPYPATVKTGTTYYTAPKGGEARGTLTNPSRPYTVVAASEGATATTGRRALYGRTAIGKNGPLGWVDVKALVRS